MRCLNKAGVASLKALGVEVCLESDALGEVRRVPAYTGAERHELWRETLTQGTCGVS